MSIPDGPFDQVPREQLRLALVLNGGVSLAVWMGGVAHEINRLTYSADDPAGSAGQSRADTPYGALLRLARTHVLADVISGTSAGGINGAALAMAQVNSLADLTALRTLWSDQGRMEALLRQPFRGQPTSLLRGDEFFLPELNRAMSALAQPFEATERPIDLTISTTLLAGSRKVIPDSMGQAIPQSEHAGRFHFRTSADDAKNSNHFAPDQIQGTAAALALASRCSAGFPFAFEPTFIPVHDDPSGRLGPTPAASVPRSTDRPDMGRFADWRYSGGIGEVLPDRSRYAVDGGVLANTPTKAALEAIERRGADGLVRRVMLLVHPHAPADKVDSPDLELTPPTLTSGMTGILGALTSQGSLNFVEEIESHNKAASTWRGGRADVLRSTPLADLYKLVRLACPQYENLQRRAAASNLAARTRPRDGWSFERIRAAAAEAQQRWSPLPYVPSERPPDVATLGVDAQTGLLHGWRWDLSVAEGVADSAAEVLRAALSVATEQETVELADAREAISQARLAIGDCRRATDDIWDSDDALRNLAPTVGYWNARLIAYRRAMVGGDDETDRAWIEQAIGTSATAAVDAIMLRHGEIGDKIASQVSTIADTLWGVRALVATIAASPRGELAELRPWAALIEDPPLTEPAAPAELVEPAADRTRLLLRLLALEIATRLVADGHATGTALPVNLVQLTLRIENYFSRDSRTPDDKVAGMSLHRFGGFLKRSWRINDWIWGRLDSATMLARIVLDPQRLRRIAALAGHQDGVLTATALVTRLEGDLYRDVSPPTDARYRKLRADAVAELAATLDADASLQDLPSYLPRLADLATYPVHMRIILEELPVLAAAIRADRVEGASNRSRGELLLAQHERLLTDIALLPAGSPEWVDLGSKGLSAFDSAGVGREPLGEESGSDEMVRTVTTAAAVLATVIDSDRSGVPAIKPVTRAIRGAALVPYWLVSGLTRGPTLARTLSVFGFAVGGILLALSLFGVVPSVVSGPAAAIGASTLLAVFGYSALRTGSLLHGVALLGLVVPLVVLAVNRHHSDASSGTAVGTVLVVFGVVVGLIVLASLPWPLRSPWSAMLAALDRNAIRRRGALKAATWTPAERKSQRWAAFWRWCLGLLIGAVVVAAGVAIGLAWDHIVKFCTDHAIALVWCAAGASVAALVAGGVIAYVEGRSLRLWRRPNAASDFELQIVAHPAGVAASWSAVYGAGYLAIAWGTGWYVHYRDVHGERVDAWMVSVVIWSAVLASVLLVVASWLIPLRYGVDLRQTLIDDPEVRDLTASSKAESEFRLLEILNRRDLQYAYLTEKAGTGSGLRLTLRGQRLADAIRGAGQRLMSQN